MPRFLEAESRAGSDAQPRSPQRLWLNALVLAAAILVIPGSAFLVKVAFHDGPGAAGATAFLWLLAGLVFLLTVDRGR